jgi:hypothetical protein
MAAAAGAGPVIYIDRSVVHEDRWNELKAGIHDLVAFIDSHQPQMVTYGVHLDEHAHQMIVVAVHPDSASLERHIDIGGPEFKKLGPFLTLQAIEVFGLVSGRAVELLEQKAAALGGRATLTLHERYAGFDRVNVSDDS